MIYKAHRSTPVASIEVSAKIGAAAVDKVIYDFSLLPPQLVLVLIIGDMAF
jgi:hypothetical protein